MADTGNPPGQVRRVVLLHGLWMNTLAMRWFGAGLHRQGFEPELVGYRSIVGGPEAAVQQLARVLRGGGAAHVVAHSLGGLVVLEALARMPDLHVARIVCLGSPLCGSGAAAVLARSPVAVLWMGRSAGLLQQGCVAWPEGAVVGMVAGCRPRGLGGLVARFAVAHDGTVAVEETRHPRLADHVVVEASHTGLLFSQAALGQTAAFLREGRFVHQPVASTGQAAGVKSAARQADGPECHG